MAALAACGGGDLLTADDSVAPSPQATETVTETETVRPSPAASTPPDGLPTPDPVAPTPSPSVSPRPDSDTASSATPAPSSTPTPTLLQAGDRGPAVTDLQRRLVEVGYWLGPVDGVYGDLTEQAVFALQGVEGVAIDGVYGPDTRAALEDADRPTPRSDVQDGLEVREDQRVVLAIRDGEVAWTWHTSAGTYERYQLEGETYLADTPNGRHEIAWQVDGWRENELGRLWRPKYYHEDGIALHGFERVPATPSSHGCTRVTIPAMNFIWEQGLAPEGAEVVVFGPTP